MLARPLHAGEARHVAAWRFVGFSHPEPATQAGRSDVVAWLLGKGATGEEARLTRAVSACSSLRCAAIVSTLVCDGREERCLERMVCPPCPVRCRHRPFSRFLRQSIRVYAELAV